MHKQAPKPFDDGRKTEARNQEPTGESMEKKVKNKAAVVTGHNATDIAEDEGRKSAPTPAEVRHRAFEIYIERGGMHGCDLDDWLQAERELPSKM